MSYEQCETSAIGSRGEELAMVWSESLTDGGDGAYGPLIRVGRFTAAAAGMG